jgi:hypothetical protein
LRTTDLLKSGFKRWEGRGCEPIGLHLVDSLKQF